MTVLFFAFLCHVEAQWTSTPCPVGQGWALATNGSIICAGGGNGVYCSSDFGSTWTGSGTGLPDLDVYGVAMAPNGTTLFAGTDGGGVFRSLNGGVTWEPANNGIDPAHQGIRAMKRCGNLTLAGNSNGVVFASVDDGDSWFGATSGSASIEYIFSNDSAAACATPGALMLSGNCGNNWSPSPNALGLRVVGVMGNRRSAVNSTGDAYSSVNNGPWSLNFDNPCSNIGTAIVTHANGMFYTTNGCGFFASSDSGATFQDENSGLGSWNLFDISICEPYAFVCGGSGVERRLLSQVFTDVPERVSVSRGITVSPNPFRDRLRLYVPSKFGQVQHVLLSTMDGRLCQDILTRLSDEVELDVPAGSYVLSVITSQDVLVTRVIRE